MFMAPLREVRKVMWGPRTARLDGHFSADLYPLNVSLTYGANAYLSFVCTEVDLAAVRFIFDGRPLIDMAERLRRLADGW